MKEGFPERLRRLRRAKKMTQAEFGQLVGLSHNHIGRYERGDAQPTAESLSRLAAALEVSGDYLLKGDHDDMAAPPRLRDPKLFEKFKQVDKLPKKDRDVLNEVIDAFLIKRKLQELAGNQS